MKRRKAKDEPTDRYLGRVTDGDSTLAYFTYQYTLLGYEHSIVGR